MSIGTTQKGSGRCDDGTVAGPSPCCSSGGCDAWWGGKVRSRLHFNHCCRPWQPIVPGG